MSEDYIVSARKYRPQTWESVVGQQGITKTLETAVANNKVAQSYLFCGPRGVGKTTCARILAREVNKGYLEDEANSSLVVFELDAASNNGVDSIRNLNEQVRIPPSVGKYKVYIIDEVHMLSTGAFNAFLKTLEEPPPHAIFILATTEKHKIIPTILSRCQIFDFSKISIADIIAYLKIVAGREGVDIDDDSLHIIAVKADGAMRDALTILDQVVAYCGKKVVYEKVLENLNVLDQENYFKIVDCVIESDVSKALILYNQIQEKGFDGKHFIMGMAQHFRDILVAKDPSTVPLLEVPSTMVDRFVEHAKKLSVPTLVRAMDIVKDCDVHYNRIRNQRLLIELCLIQLCSILHNEEQKKKSDFVLIPFEKKKLEVRKEVAVVVPDPVVVEDPPATAPTEKEIPVVAEKSSPPVSTPAPLLKSGVKIKDTGVSLSGLFEGSGVALKAEDNSESQKEAVQADEPYTQDEFELAWKKYAQRKLEEQKHSLYATLMAEIPRCINHEVMLTLNNSVQDVEVTEYRGEMMEFLRGILKNSKLVLKTKLVKDDSRKLTYYTDKDKFEAMKKSNPALDNFRKKLFLDLDF